MKQHLRFAKFLTHLMDTRFNLFGFRFGLDPLLDLWPWFGSLLGTAISCYLYWIAFKLEVPTSVYRKMGMHLFWDFVLGEIPFIGFIFDAMYHANEMNLKLLTPYLDQEVLEGV
jgi:hypothetical protein